MNRHISPQHLWSGCLCRLWQCAALWLAICSALTINIAAQTPLRFERVPEGRGLSYNFITAIVQDQRGFLWFGTFDGLNRYDGYTFTVFRHNSKKRGSILNNQIRTLLEDRQGTLWIGTSNGLCKYDRLFDTFSTVLHTDTTQSISSNVVSALCEDAEGNIWVGTDKGLNCFQKSTHQWLQVSLQSTSSENTSSENTRFANTEKIQVLKIQALCFDKQGKLWIGTQGAGIYAYTPSTKHVQLHRHAAFENIWALCADSFGAVWVGTENHGVARFQPNTNSVTLFAAEHASTHGFNDNTVHSLYEDKHGVLWAGTNFGGILRFEREHERWTAYQHSPANTTSPLSNKVWALYEDNSGVFWIGTSAGINFIDPSARKFTEVYYPANSTQNSTQKRIKTELHADFGNNKVWAVHEDPQGLLWLGTESGFLQCLNRSTGITTRYMQGFRNSTIRYIVEDTARHVLWLATEYGLHAFDKRRKQCRVYVHDPLNPHSLPDNRVRNLLLNSDGSLWVGTEFQGMSLFQPQTGLWKHYRHIHNEQNSLSDNTIRALYRDRAGMLWIGTEYGGLNCFDAASQRFTAYSHNPNNPTSLAGNAVLSVLEHTDGSFWLGTANGLHRFDRTTGNSVVFTEKDGLSNDVIYGIVADSTGTLWLSTNKGLSRFSPANGTVRNFDENDGLQANEFSPGAYTRGTRGELFFGGVRGVNVFLPGNIRENTFVPPVLLTALKTFNRPVVLDTAISERHEVWLQYTDNVFSFDFAALNYQNAEKNQYAYMLEGFDKDWIPAGTDRSATYTNLQGGSYRFRVKASNNDGLWNEHGAVLTVHIIPPFWQTWHFKAGLALTVCVLLWGAYKVRVRLLERKQELLKELVRGRTAQLQRRNQELEEANTEICRQNEILAEQSRMIELANTDLQSVNVELTDSNQKLARLNDEKNEFLAIASHDLKNPLSGIRISATILQEHASALKPREIQDIAGTIETSSNRMFELIKNLLDINALESGAMLMHLVRLNVADTVRFSVQNNRAAAEAKDIRLHLHLHGAAQNMALIQADEAALMQIMDNLLSNAVKYSPHGKAVDLHLLEAGIHAEQADTLRAAGITLTRSLNDDYVLFAVHNEGQGLTDEDKKRLFGRFARLSARPTGGEHSTGLGLSIVKKLTEYMGGVVWCESEVGKGATFLLAFPAVR